MNRIIVQLDITTNEDAEEVQERVTHAVAGQYEGASKFELYDAIRAVPVEE